MAKDDPDPSFRWSYARCKTCGAGVTCDAKAVKPESQIMGAAFNASCATWQNLMRSDILLRIAKDPLPNEPWEVRVEGLDDYVAPDGQPFHRRFPDEIAAEVYAQDLRDRQFQGVTVANREESGTITSTDSVPTLGERQ